MTLAQLLDLCKRMFNVRPTAYYVGIFEWRVVVGDDIPVEDAFNIPPHRVSQVLKALSIETGKPLPVAVAQAIGVCRFRGFGIR